jgi:hypothetical protein
VLGACERADRQLGPPQHRCEQAKAPAPGSVDASELCIILDRVGKGPVVADLLVMDPGGHRAGLAPIDMRVRGDIPNATYDSAPPPDRGMAKQFHVVTPTPGTYAIDIGARRAGAFNLIVRLITPGGEVREGSVSDQTAPGDAQRYSFVYDTSHTGPITLTSRGQRNPFSP